MDTGAHDVTAFMGFPALHRVPLRSAKPLEPLNKDV
jgi:hypothetical protein